MLTSIYSCILDSLTKMDLLYRYDHWIKFYFSENGYIV